MTNVRILFVEDEFIVASNLRNKLQCLGYEVTDIDGLDQNHLRILHKPFTKESLGKLVSKLLNNHRVCSLW